LEKNKKFNSFFDKNSSGNTDTLVKQLVLKLDLLEKRVRILEDHHKKMMREMK